MNSWFSVSFSSSFCTSTSWLQCSLFFFVFSVMFFTHADFITMLPWTRGGSLNPHTIYSRGRNYCFHFLMLCIYIFFHFGGFCKKKRALYCLTIVLFEMPPPPCPLWSPQSLLTSTPTVSCHSRGETETFHHGGTACTSVSLSSVHLHL